MNRKLPAGALEYYVGLGPGRSYQAVAEHFGVTKQTVTNRAVRDGWQERVRELERKAHERSEEKALESLEAMNGRHLKTVRVIQARALETLRSMPLSTAMEAVRALDLAIRQERTIRGEPGDRTAVSVEDVVKKEYERWMSGDTPDQCVDDAGAPDHGDDDVPATEPDGLLP